MKDPGPPTSSQIIGFHEIASKQGYSFPIIPGKQHSYRLSLTTENGNIPSDWVVEFSDYVVGNRFGSVEYTNLSLNGILCGLDGLVSSHHDRRYMWSGDQYMASEAWGNTGACASALEVNIYFTFQHNIFTMLNIILIFFHTFNSYSYQTSKLKIVMQLMMASSKPYSVVSYVIINVMRQTHFVTAGLRVVNASLGFMEMIACMIFV